MINSSEKRLREWNDVYVMLSLCRTENVINFEIAAIGRNESIIQKCFYIEGVVISFKESQSIE